MFQRLTGFILMLVVTAFVSTAFAQVLSTPDGYNEAEMALTFDGMTLDQVEFEVPAATLTLDYGALAPNQSFHLVVPVTNNTDRTITVSEYNNSLTSAVVPGVTITSWGSIDLAPGATGNLVWLFEIGAIDPNDYPVDYAVEHTFYIRGVGHAVSVPNQTFGN